MTICKMLISHLFIVCFRANCFLFHNRSCGWIPADGKFNLLFTFRLFEVSKAKARLTCGKSKLITTKNSQKNILAIRIMPAY